MKYRVFGGLVMYGAHTIIKDLQFEIRDDEKIAIVGRNGCGKTTLLKVIAGELELSNLDSDEDAGITQTGGVRIGYLKQMNFEDAGISVREEIEKVFAPIHEVEKRIRVLEETMKQDASSSVLSAYAGEMAKLECLGGYSYMQDLETVFQKFGFGLEDLERPIGELSGGQQTRVAFVKLLLSRPDIMLLDEPTNHLDIATIEWLEGYLKVYPRAVVIVSHDRMFLEQVTSVTYEIEYGRIKRYAGNYSAFLRMKEEAFRKQEKDYIAQQNEIKRLTEWIEKWKNTPTKIASVRSKRMVIEHMEKIEKPRRFDVKAFRSDFEPLVQSHSEVLRLCKLQIGYEQPLATVSGTIRRGNRVAVIGDNGIGKSTLLKTLMGMISPLGGSYQWGGNVTIGYFDQHIALQKGDPEREKTTTILEDFWELYPKLTRGEVRSALASFLFEQEEVDKYLYQLSGGERVRLALVKMLRTRPNLLILDEPTNHMDIIGKQALEEMLTNFQGTLLFVSHDRYFVREVANTMLVFAKDQVQLYPYGYEEYIEEQQKKVAKDGNVSDTKDKGPAPHMQENRQEELLEGKLERKGYNPGKEESRRKQRYAKCEGLLEQCDMELAQLRMQLHATETASDYAYLEAVLSKIQEKEAEAEALLEEMDQLENYDNS